jgi:acyl-CoA thioesterase FadM
VVAAGQIRFRRELKPFRAFTLETRILTWSDSHVVMEHRLISGAKDGSPILNAIALVRAGLYDRKERRFVPMDRLLNEIGLQAEPSEAAPEVEAFLRAEETLKSAA